MDKDSESIDSSYHDDFSGRADIEGNALEVLGAHEGFALTDDSLGMLKKSQSGALVLPPIPSDKKEAYVKRKSSQAAPASSRSSASVALQNEVDALSKKIVKLKNSLLLSRCLSFVLFLCCVALFVMRDPVQHDVAPSGFYMDNTNDAEVGVETEELKPETPLEKESQSQEMGVAVVADEMVDNISAVNDTAVEVDVFPVGDMDTNHAYRRFCEPEPHSIIRYFDS